MAFQVSPGINVSEIDLTTVVPNVATSIGAIGGGFQWGPVLERISITTENDLLNEFGPPLDNADNDGKYFLTAANYLAYSNNLIVTRMLVLMHATLLLVTMMQVQQQHLTLLITKMIMMVQLIQLHYLLQNIRVL